MVEDIREMLAGLPPSDWERHMAEVAAYEAALVAERDRWRNRARAMHRQAVQRHRRIQNMVADNLAADESNDAGFVALRARLAKVEEAWRHLLRDTNSVQNNLIASHNKLAAADARAEHWKATSRELSWRGRLSHGGGCLCVGMIGASGMSTKHLPTAPPERGTYAWWEDTVNAIEADWISLATMHADDPLTVGQLERIEGLLAAIHAASAPEQAHRIDFQGGTVDDVAISGTFFRMEQMDKGAWWVCIYRGEERTMFSLRWDKRKRDIVATITEDTIGCSDDTTPPEGETGEGK